MDAKNIVVVFPSNTYKKKTFNYGLKLARTFEGTLTLLNCMYKPPPTFGFFEIKRDKKIQEKQKNVAKKTLEKFQKIAKDSEIKTKIKVILTDSTSKSIISYITEHDADLVILESPKISKFEESYFGIIVCDLHPGLKCPLLILK